MNIRLINSCCFKFKVSTFLLVVILVSDCIGAQASLRPVPEEITPAERAKIQEIVHEVSKFLKNVKKVPRELKHDYCDLKKKYPNNSFLSQVAINCEN